MTLKLTLCLKKIGNETNRTWKLNWKSHINHVKAKKQQKKNMSKVFVVHTSVIYAVLFSMRATLLRRPAYLPRVT